MRINKRLLNILVLIGAVAILAGCVTQSQFLNSRVDMAMQTAVNRAQYEYNCQQVTPTLISSEVVQPALQGPFVNGIQRAEYDRR